MMNVKQAKALLQSYKLARSRANSRLKRAEAWKEYVDKYGCGTEICAELIEEAREFLALEADITSALDNASIKESYRTFLSMRFIDQLEDAEICEKLYINKRWLYRLQVRALQAFAESV